MIIKLEFIAQSEKAYQLNNGSWIPKSILDSRGLINQFFQIKDWFLASIVDKAFEEDNIALKQASAIGEMRVKMNELPKDVLEYWKKYWSGCDSNFYMTDSTDRKWEISEYDLGIYS